nr:thioesterase family protein [Micromonospora sp. DSM 115978]
MSDRKPDFADLLTLEVVDRDIFRGLCHDGAPMRAFGGQVAAQAQVAAGRTVEPDRRMHSLHGYFLRHGRTDAPIVYLVERIRDGRSFTTRRVSAVQAGETIFSMSASFQRPRETAETHQLRAPAVPGPDDLSRWWEPIYEAPEYRPFLLIDVRTSTSVEPSSTEAVADGMPRQNVWVRVDQPLPDDPLLHICALTYL